MRHQFNDAVIAKLTVKKVLSQIDHIQTLLTVGETTPEMKLTIIDWFMGMRIDLRHLEVMTEQSVVH